MSKRNKHQRNQLLLLATESPDEVIDFEGYLSFNDQSDWYTFTQVTIIESGIRISAHINLPKFKIDRLLKITIQDNHKAFYFSGKPSFYTNKGTKRGSIQLESISRK